MGIILDNVSLLSLYPCLEKLKLPAGGFDYNSSVSFQPLKNCPDLTILCLLYPEMTDLVEIVVSLKKLQFFVFITTSACEVIVITEELNNNQIRQPEDSSQMFHQV